MHPLFRGADWRELRLDIDPRVLIERAQLEFMATRNAMQQIAPLVAREKGLKERDYIAVIRALKQEQIPNDRLETHYRTNVMPVLERQIDEHDIVTVPGRSRSAGTSATQLASSSTAPSGPAMTSNQYQPPSVKVASDRSNRNTPGSGPVTVSSSTRWARPSGIER